MSIADKLATIAENEQKVYDAGKKSEYDSFWDEFQAGGARTNYMMAFTTGWTADNFKPKYDLIPTSGAYLFYGNTIAGLDLREDNFRQQYGVDIDLTQATNLTWFVAYSTVRYVGTVKGAPNPVTGLNNMFAQATNLVEISKIIIPPYSSEFSAVGAFTNCISLKEVRFEGSIDANMSLSSSPLSRDSIVDIIEHLSTSATGKTVTFKKTAVDTAFETSSGAADGSTSDEWAELVAQCPTWTVSVV